jgi:hypothetical protein
MKVTKCDLCKREIEEIAKTEFLLDGLYIKFKDDTDWKEICEPCRNRIIRKIIKENFPLEK